MTISIILIPIFGIKDRNKGNINGKPIENKQSHRYGDNKHKGYNHSYKNRASYEEIDPTQTKILVAKTLLYEGRS